MASLSQSVTSQSQIISAPLTLNQERLWFLHRLNPQDISYNMGMAIRFDGELNPKDLFAACSMIEKRHASLRTYFIEENGKPIAKIGPFKPLTPVIIDYSKKKTDHIEEDILQELKKQTNIPFNLQNGPIIRQILLHYNDNLHVLIFCVHHIIYDGQSLFLHLKELAENYESIIKQNLSASLPNVSQHFEFAKSQKSRLTEETKEKILSYWKNQLIGCNPLELPTDSPRTILPPNIENKQFIVSDELCKQIIAFSKKTEKSLFNVLFSAYCALLYRYTNQTDFIIGVPTHGRSQNGYENTIGFFVNMLPIRVNLHESTTFTELLNQIKIKIREALINQEVSLPDLTAQLNLKRSANRDPLFQVIFEIDDSPLSDVNFENIQMKLVAVESDKAPYDIVFEVHTVPNNVVINVKYNAIFFMEKTIERLFSHWLRILAEITENPDIPLSKIPMLLPEEYKLITEDWNLTKKPIPNTTITQQFEEQVTKNPNNVAINFKDDYLTYEQLNNQANQLAYYLRKNNITTEAVVTICLERSIDIIVCLLAILKSGGSYHVLDIDYPEERINFELRETQSKLIITKQIFKHKFANFQGKILSLDQQKNELDKLPIENISNNLNLDNIAYVIFTSGSTGKPKGVLLKHRGLVNLISWYQDCFNISTNDRASQFASPIFDAMGCEVWPFLASGSSVYIIDNETRLNPTLLLNWISQNKITICDLPTTVGEIILNMEWPTNTSLRILKLGGEKVAPLPKKEFSFEIWNTYGPTETTIECIANRIDTKVHNYYMPPIGKPIQNFQAYILDTSLQPVPIGVPGELYIAGPGLAKCYLNQPQLTAENFLANLFAHDRVYKTGDICKFLDDGNIEFIKRNDDQIKLYGFRIELGEIQTALKNHPTIKEAIVLISSQNDNKQLIAYLIQKNENTTLNANEWRQHLKKHLPNFMIPSIFIYLNHFPMTHTGKIDRNALALKNEFLPQYEFIAPSTSTELALANIWCNVLKLKQVSLNDNFFELGGSSLTSMQLLAKINQKCKTNFSLATIFKYQTLKEQVDYVNSSQHEETPQVIIPFSTSNTNQALFCFHPVGGNATCYLPLAKALTSHFSVYGIQYPYSNHFHFDSLEKLSDYYLTQIKKIQPQGPYALLAWSTGGLLAFEVAKKIIQDGGKISILAMIDTYNPIQSRLISNFDNSNLLWHLLNVILPLSNKPNKLYNVILFLLKHHLMPLSLISRLLGSKNQIDIHSSIELLRQDLTQSGPSQFPISDWVQLLKENKFISNDFDVQKLIQIYQEIRNLVKLSEKYQPTFYDGEIVFFSAKKPFFTHQWQLNCQQLTNINLPVNHYQAIKDIQSLEVISRHIIQRTKS